MENPLKTVVELFLLNDMFIVGGLLICFLFLILMVLERLVSYQKYSVKANQIIIRLAEMLQNQNIGEAIEYLKNHKGLLPKVLSKAFVRFDKDRYEIESAISTGIKEQTYLLEKCIGAIGVISILAPCIGLLGTIFGFIVSKEINGSSFNALAVGLIIAIPAIIFYFYFQRRKNMLLREMEIYGNKLTEMIILIRTGEPFPEDIFKTDDKKESKSKVLPNKAE